MAGPSTMDAATWGMIHSTAWPHTYAAELALATFHDTFGLSWITAIPVTVLVMRTALAPFLIMSQVTAHKMSKAAPQIQDAQKTMMMAIERGVPIKEAQVHHPLLSRPCNPQAELPHKHTSHLLMQHQAIAFSLPLQSSLKGTHLPCAAACTLDRALL